MQESDLNTSLMLHVKILESATKPLTDWYMAMHQELASFDGFLSVEILSPDCTHTPVWTIIQEFSNRNALDRWQQSSEWGALRENLTPLCVDYQVELHPARAGKMGATEVIVTSVEPEHCPAYQKWLGKIQQAEATFPGFQRVYVQAPRHPTSLKSWITILEFDTEEHLENWLISDARKKLLQEAMGFVTSQEGHRMASPFGGWFNEESIAAWKQTMLVLLVLFPIVMLELEFLRPLTLELNLSLATFLANALSVILLTWPCIPIVLKLLDWWVKPKSKRATQLGTGLVCGLYMVEILLFWK